MGKISSGEAKYTKPGITRRRFLQGVGSLLGSGLLRPVASWLPTPSTSVESGSVEIFRDFTEFSRSEILHFPNQFIDSVLRFLDQNPDKKEKFPQLIQIFSESEGQGLQAEKNRKYLDTYAEKCGPQIEELLRRLKLVDPEDELIWTLEPFQRLYQPLLDLQQFLQYEDVSDEGIQHLVYRVETLLHWITPLADKTKTPSQLKTVFDERAQRQEQQSGLWASVAQEWELKRSDPSLSPDELRNNQEIFSVENEQRFREIFERLRVFYPRYLAEVKHLGFTDDESALASGRSFFQDQEDTIGFVPPFFLGHNTGVYGIETDLKMVLHEVAHAYDPNSHSERAWTWANPEEVIAYYEKYIELLEGFHEFISGDFDKNMQPVAAEGLEYFMLSRWQEGVKFGVDQLLLPEDWESYCAEMLELRDLVETLTQTPEGQSHIRNRGLDYFFEVKEQPLLFWQMRAQQHLPTGVWTRNPFYSEWVGRQMGLAHKDLPDDSEVLQGFSDVSQFSHITPSLIDELLVVGEQIFSSEEEKRYQPEIQEILNLLLDFKSLCTFILGVLRYRVVQYGGIRNSGSEVMSALHASNATQRVFGHFFHMMTGPLTQYTNVAGFSVYSRDEDQRVQETLTRADQSVVTWDAYDQNALLSAFQTPEYSPDRRRADAFAGFINNQAHRVWKSRELLWGATGEYVFPHAVKEISLAVFPEEQLPDEEYYEQLGDKGMG